MVILRDGVVHPASQLDMVIFSARKTKFAVDRRDGGVAGRAEGDSPEILYVSHSTLSMVNKLLSTLLLHVLMQSKPLPRTKLLWLSGLEMIL